MPDLIDDDGLVRAGKGEAMLIGMALAAMTGRHYVGYVDADNYVPGAVHEYCKAYAAGLHLADSPYSMVRISWHSKPKLRDGRLFFTRKGRSSMITNEWLNRFLAEYSGFGTEVIATGNAGEHAMSLDLGLSCGWPAVSRSSRTSSGPVRAVRRGPGEHQRRGDGQFGADPADRDPQPAFPRQYGRGARPGHADAGAERHLPLAVTLPAVRQAIVDFLVEQGALGAGPEPPRSGSIRRSAPSTSTCSTTCWTPRRSASGSHGRPRSG